MQVNSNGKTIPNSINSITGRQNTSGNSQMASRMPNLPLNIKEPLYKNKFLIGGLALVVVIMAGLLTYNLFFTKTNFIEPTVDKLEQALESIKDDGLYENPLNGVKISQEAASKFKDKKPIAVMVNNHLQARPSSGLSKADVIYEVVAEGGITRLMPIFYSNLPESVGSIRSARYYFAELASSYKAHFIHWGVAYQPDCQKLPSTNPRYCGNETDPRTDAKERIAKLGLANLDGGNYSCDEPTCAFGRDPKKLGKMPLEHTAFVRLPLIYDLAKKIRPDESWHKYIEFKKWKFKDDAPDSQRGSIGITPPITYNYWDTMPGFNIRWEYDKAGNDYIRYQGDVKQVDFDTQKELRAKVVVIRFTRQEPALDKKNHLLTYLTGKGAALVFQDGKVIKGFWSRTTHEDMDVYTDEDGKEIEFNRGQVWVQLVPQGNAVKYGGEVIDNTVKGVNTSAPDAPTQKSTTSIESK